MRINLNITLDLDDEYVADLETEIPRSIRYWALTWRDKDTGVRQIREATDKDAPVHALPEDWVARGLRVLCESGGFHTASKIISGDADGESLDALVQAAVLGEVRYG